MTAIIKNEHTEAKMRGVLIRGVHKESNTTTAYKTPTATPEGMDRSNRKINTRSTPQAEYNTK
jgi:hypothetical protein